MIEIDFSPRSKIAIRAWLGLGIVGVAFFAMLYVLYQQSLAVETLSTHIERMHERKVRQQRNAQPLRLSDQQYRAFDRLQQVSDRLSFPWERFFFELEQLSNKDIAILALTPDAESKHLSMLLEAKDIAAIVQFLQRMNTSPWFVQAVATQQKINQQNPDRPVQISIEAKLIPQQKEQTMPSSIPITPGPIKDSHP